MELKVDVVFQKRMYHLLKALVQIFHQMQKTASEIFVCLFADSLEDKIVQETNLYTRQKK